MTWPRYLEICEYWQQVPPLAEVVAGFMGATRSEPTPPPPDGSDDAFAALQRDFGMIG